MSTGDSTTAHRALLAQVAAYLEWEEQLGGVSLPRAVPTAPVAPLPAPQGGLPAPQGGAVGVAEAPPQRAPLPSEASPPRHPQGAPAPVPEDRASLSVLARTAPVVSGGDVHLRLAQLDEEVRACTRCDLHTGRRHTVFARGNPESKLVFVGEAPGQEEDRAGQPFVGPAGQLLDKMVAAMGIARDDVYICNVVKCRPPNNRTPLPSEAGACAPFLLGQIDALRPKVMVALGRCAAENMGLVAGGTWRGRWGQFRGVPVMPTYHPAFLLRSPEYKRPVWEDLQQVMAKLRELA